MTRTEQQGLALGSRALAEAFIRNESRKACCCYTTGCLSTEFVSKIVPASNCAAASLIIVSSVGCSARMGGRQPGAIWTNLLRLSPFQALTLL